MPNLITGGRGRGGCVGGGWVEGEGVQCSVKSLDFGIRPTSINTLPLPSGLWLFCLFWPLVVILLPISQRRGENRKKKMQVTQDLEPSKYSVSGSYYQLLSLGNVHYGKDVRALKLKWEGPFPCMNEVHLVGLWLLCFSCTSVFLCLLIAPSAFLSFLASSPLVGNYSYHCGVFFSAKIQERELGLPSSPFCPQTIWVGWPWVWGPLL